MSDNVYDYHAKQLSTCKHHQRRPHGKPVIERCSCIIKIHTRDEIIEMNDTLRRTQDNPRANPSKEWLLKKRYGCVPKKAVPNRHKTRLIKGKSGCLHEYHYDIQEIIQSEFQ
jgi:hypothetical protein